MASSIKITATLCVDGRPGPITLEVLPGDVLNVKNVREAHNLADESFVITLNGARVDADAEIKADDTVFAVKTGRDFAQLTASC